MNFDEGFAEDGFDRRGMEFGPEMMKDGEADSGWGKAINTLKKPYVWGTAVGVAAIAVITAVLLIRRKHKRIDFDE